MAGLPCVVYAAKSTEDKRGSISTQLVDCHEAIEAAGGRTIAGEYQDEAVSAYTGNRGSGLAKAMGQVAELAGLYSAAELWVQHSDRLARGDGKTARHVVELALWASKAEVTIRSLQDPDTFRDLLYAVVTGQRNHLDSQRKGASVAAGLRRSVARGAYAGTCVDGYRVVVSVGPNNAVRKHLEIDRVRAPLIELIFALALADSTPWQIAEAVTAAGWTTARGLRTGRQVRFEAWGVLRILNNPRYAGLSAWKGDVLARAEWPAFISPEQFARLRIRRTRERRITSIGPRPSQPFLLVGVARCNYCLSAIHAITGTVRQDGSQARSYLCVGHAYKHCAASPIDAVAVDWAVIQFLNSWIQAEPKYDSERPTEPDERRDQLKNRIAHALAADDLAGAGALFDELRSRVLPQAIEPEAELSPLVSAGSDSLRRALLDEFYGWAASALDHPAKIAVADTERLRSILRRWFERIELGAIDGGFSVTPVYHGGRRGGNAPVDYGQWRLSIVAAGYARPPQAGWTREEIIVAIQRWAEEYGEQPAYTDWPRSTQAHPMANTAIKVFGSWRAALRAAGYDKSRRRRPGPPRDRDSRGRYLPIAAPVPG
jgi:DNA invertase Pin-like site-specific DNA recombinase